MHVCTCANGAPCYLLLCSIKVFRSSSPCVQCG
uniref:Uncharacterized protein n=1 Tax=Anguilla anguilla TaxID=7936 RepID=A0A0E9TRD1_ANGAN